jgi:hemerythrin-like domain-containing protein
MLEVHAAFKREFSLLPALVRSVSPGNQQRAHIVADHIHFLMTILHEHHTSEDEFLWPKLLDRGSAEVIETAHLMESHHATLAKILEDLGLELDVWHDSVATRRGPALTAILNRMTPALIEHMTLEESRALPVIEQHVSADEWQQLVEAVRGRLSNDNLPLILGMVMYESFATSPPPDESFEAQALRTYGSYCMRVHGTATPRLSSALAPALSESQ